MLLLLKTHSLDGRFWLVFCLLPCNFSRYSPSKSTGGNPLPRGETRQLMLAILPSRSGFLSRPLSLYLSGVATVHHSGSSQPSSML
uniref:Putative secreted protein n=1 Tax=Anopheles marajoara TaxID=58244 RepID=A0A2M4CAU6_9DIPT